MRLMHVTTIPETLGFLRGQVGYMQRHGWEVHTLSAPGPYLEDFVSREKVVAHVVDMERRITPLADLKAVYRIWRVIRRVRPDIVHAHTPKGGLLGMLGAFLAGTSARVYHIHGLPFVTARGWRRRLLRATEAVACGLATQVLCVSASVRDLAVRSRISPATRIRVLHHGSINGVDAEGRFDPAIHRRERSRIRRRYGIPESAVVLGFVGRVVRDKGVIELTTAWKQIREQYPDTHLLVVGPFEAHDPLPEETRLALEEDPRLHLVGLDWNTGPLYAAMDVLILPTHREGFPVVPLEAAAMALPTVTTTVPGCVDAVQHEVTGLCVAPHDPDEIIRAVCALIDDPERRERMGAAARARVLRDFRPVDLWAATHQEYLRLRASDR